MFIKINEFLKRKKKILKFQYTLLLRNLVIKFQNLNVKLKVFMNSNYKIFYNFLNIFEHFKLKSLYKYCNYRFSILLTN